MRTVYQLDVAITCDTARELKVVKMFALAQGDSVNTSNNAIAIKYLSRTDVATYKTFVKALGGCTLKVLEERKLTI